MEAKAILKKVKEDYNLIADEFDATRQKPWKEFFLCKKYARGRVLDVGCGNGRLAYFLKKQIKNKTIDYIGIDNSRALIKIAKKNHPFARFRYGDILNIPLGSWFFDTIFCIAVLHHIPSKNLQLKALKEMKRVLKKSGVLVITVWNLQQKKYKKYIDAKTREAFIPWGQDKKVRRFYYAFTAPEFKQLLKKAGFSKLKNKSANRNLIFICRK